MSTNLKKCLHYVEFGDIIYKMPRLNIARRSGETRSRGPKVYGESQSLRQKDGGISAAAVIFFTFCLS